MDSKNLVFLPFPLTQKMTWNDWERVTMNAMWEISVNKIYTYSFVLLSDVFCFLQEF